MADYNFFGVEKTADSSLIDYIKVDPGRTTNVAPFVPDLVVSIDPQPCIGCPMIDYCAKTYSACERFFYWTQDGVDKDFRILKRVHSTNPIVRRNYVHEVGDIPDRAQYERVFSNPWTE